MRARASIAMAGLLALSCGQPGAYAEWKSYASEGGEYRLRYLDPPWRIVDVEGARVRLAVENNATRFGELDSSLSSKYDLTVEPVRRSAEANARAAASAASGRGEEIVAPPAPVETRSGDRGFEVVTRQVGGEYLYRRLVWIDREGGGAIHLRFVTVPNPTEAEVDAMIDSVDADPEAP